LIILREKYFNFTFEKFKLDKGTKFWGLSESLGSNMYPTTQVFIFKIKLLIRAIKIRENI
jgi:hypothetical protein